MCKQLTCYKCKALVDALDVLVAATTDAERAVRTSRDAFGNDHTRTASAVQTLSQLRERLKAVELPGGYSVGDKVVSQIGWSVGSKTLSIGDVGTVIGPCAFPSAPDSDQVVRVHFPSCGGKLNIRVSQVCRQDTQLPGGYKIGDRVVSLISCESPEYGSIAVGDVGTVCGPCQNSSIDDVVGCTLRRRIQVKFPDVKGAWPALVTDLHREGQEPETK